MPFSNSIDRARAAQRRGGRGIGLARTDMPLGGSSRPRPERRLPPGYGTAIRSLAMEQTLLRSGSVELRRATCTLATHHYIFYTYTFTIHCIARFQLR